MSVAEFPRTEDWYFESIIILHESTVFLELASSVISKLRYTLSFVESLLAQTDLCLFCLSINVCFSFRSKWFENACCITVTHTQKENQTTLISKKKATVRACQKETKI